MRIPHLPYPGHDDACRALADHFLATEPTAIDDDRIALAGLFQMVAEGFCGALSPDRPTLAEDMAQLRAAMDGDRDA